ncbi:hypothetical protein ACP4OV_002416 [Aristida adscensionis]
MMGLGRLAAHGGVRRAAALPHRRALGLSDGRQGSLDGTPPPQ